MPFVKLVKNKQYFKRYQVKFRRRREGKTDYRARRKLITPDRTKYNMPKYRLVIRFSNRYVTAQIVHSVVKGDHVVCQANSRELERYGLTVGLKNFSAAYCTGFLCARRCLKMFNLDEVYTGAIEEDDSGEKELDITGEVVKTKMGKKEFFVDSYDLEAAMGEDGCGKKPFRAILDTGATTTTSGHRIFAAMKGAADAGMDIPHNEKRFAGYDRDDKSFDPEDMKNRILGQHVADYMEELMDNDEMKFKTQFKSYIDAEITSDSYLELVEEVLEAIREDPTAASPSVREKIADGTFKPDNSFKRKAKDSIEERKARVCAKKVEMIAAKAAAEMSDDDE